MENKIPTEIKGFLSILAKTYDIQEDKELFRIVRNSQVEVKENYSYDNYNGGINGHKILLHLSNQIYIQVLPLKEKYEEDILSKLRKMFDYLDHEFIEDLKIIPDLNKVDQDEAPEVGIASKTKIRIKDDSTITRIWEVPEYYKVFISHKDDEKLAATDLKRSLKEYGITCFVAHEDIEPSQEWQSDIESALFSADACIAMLSEYFHKSNWTDQEIGIAIGRGIPIIPLKMCKDPYGFIGKYQALKFVDKNAIIQIIEILTNYESFINHYIQLLKNSPTYNFSIRMFKILQKIKRLTPLQVNHIKKAFLGNIQVSGCYSFSNIEGYGKGLVKELHRITGEDYSEEFEKIEKLIQKAIDENFAS